MEHGEEAHFPSRIPALEEVDSGLTKYGPLLPHTNLVHD